MKRLIEFIKDTARDERGAEGLEKLLILAAVALPLLGLLIYFRDGIQEWISGEASTVMQDAQGFDRTNTGLGG